MGDKKISTKLKVINLGNNKEKIISLIDKELNDNKYKYVVDFMSTDLRVIKNNIKGNNVILDKYYEKEFNKLLKNKR